MQTLLYNAMIKSVLSTARTVKELDDLSYRVILAKIDIVWLIIQSGAFLTIPMQLRYTNGQSVRLVVSLAWQSYQIKKIIILDCVSFAYIS